MWQSVKFIFSNWLLSALWNDGVMEQCAFVIGDDVVWMKGEATNERKDFLETHCSSTPGTPILQL